MLLHPNPVHSQQLSWDKAHDMFVGEISTIRGFGRVWDDAADAGLTLVSRYDGREIVFAVSHEQRDRDGDVQYWDLVPALPGDGGSVPFTIRIYND